jgi:hypothetical protein
MIMNGPTLAISLSSWFYSLFGNLITSLIEEFQPTLKSKAGIFRLPLPEIPALNLNPEF